VGRRNISTAEWNAHLAPFTEEQAEEIVTRHMDARGAWEDDSAQRRHFGVSSKKRFKLYLPTRARILPMPSIVPPKGASFLHEVLANRAIGWIILFLSTASGLGVLASIFTSAGLPKWGSAILLVSVTAGVIVQSFKASLNKVVSIVSAAGDLGVSLPDLADLSLRKSLTPPGGMEPITMPPLPTPPLPSPPLPKDKTP
jgi:hypothetical protein